MTIPSMRALINLMERAPTTPGFKSWFAGSKVVDDSGNPLVVHHGTRQKGGFHEFNTNGETSTLGDDFKFSPLGAWFSDAERIAKNYATDWNDPDGSGPVMSVYLAIKNPFEISYDALGSKVTKQADAHKLRAQLETKGYDGMKVGRYGGSDGYDYVAFHPSQIKSVTNAGTFDPSNPNINEAN